MARVSDLHDEWMRDPEYRAAYEELEPEFEDLRRRLRPARSVEVARATGTRSRIAFEPA